MQARNKHFQPDLAKQPEITKLTKPRSPAEGVANSLVKDAREFEASWAKQYTTLGNALVFEEKNQVATGWGCAIEQPST